MSGRPDGSVPAGPRSERVRSVRALAGRPARLRRGLFLVEGPQGVREAVRWVPGDVQDVYLSPPALARYPEIAEAADSSGVRVRRVSTDVVDAMSADAQGALAVVRVTSQSLGDVVERSPRLVAVLAAVRDPGNAGTVIRAADAAGADAVVLTAGSVDVHNPKVVRASAGSLLHLPVVTAADLGETVGALRAAGLGVLAADGRGSLDLDELLDATLGDAAGRAGTPDLSRATAWVFGNEAWGLPEEQLALADAVVRIPIHGRAESLNLAAAVAVCLYASARVQRRIS